MNKSSLCFGLYEVAETDEEPRDVWDRLFAEDLTPNKVKLIGGRYLHPLNSSQLQSRYRDREGKHHILDCVQSAEKILQQSSTDIPWLNHFLFQKEEIPPTGIVEVNQLIEELILGEVTDCDFLILNRKGKLFQTWK